MLCRILLFWATLSLFPTLSVYSQVAGSLNIPEWAINIPRHCFVGISKPSPLIEEARQQATNSAVSQILQAMGAEYSLTHVSILTGTDTRSHHELNERLSYTARWFIRSLQQNIVKSDLFRIDNNYVYFVLVHFPPRKIERLRKLTNGPEASARIVENNSEKVLVEVTENNDVGVTLTDYQMKITRKNRHAGVITFFAWKVPEYSTWEYKSAIINSINLRGDSKTFNIPYPANDSHIRQMILGTEIQTKIMFNGYDEIGRKISVTVENLH